MPPPDPNDATSPGRKTGADDGADDFAPGALFERAMMWKTGSAWEPPDLGDLRRLLPHYEIHALIGRGGMGAVYRATQPDLEREVAIKLLPAELADEVGFVGRFRREARTLAGLQHPGIVHIHDFGQTSAGHLYFVMEFVDGTDLHRMIHGEGVDSAQALDLVSQICDALQYAHGRGVIHRDIKPANILVTRDGRAKLADFGLARPQEMGAQPFTVSRVAMGTPDYMAPEQKRGEGDHRVDLYALGVMLYEMLCGRLPQGAWQKPSQRASVDVRLDQVVTKALQEDPGHRYQQASDVKSDVEAIRKSHPGGYGRKILWLSAVLGLMVAGWQVWSNTARPVQLNSTAAPSVAAPVAAPVAFADQPWTNSLGLEFLPIPGSESLLAATEARESDWRAFLKDSGYRWKRFVDPTVSGTTKPDDHPIGGVSWHDANAFCRWLTEKERREGKLPAAFHYRLPTDREWSLAARLGEEPTAAPADLSGRTPGYVWGPDWPPPRDVVNVGDIGDLPSGTDTSNYVANLATAPVVRVDDCDETCSVKRFPPNAGGFYGLTGNVTEWVWDKWRPSHNEHGIHFLRGRGWFLPTKGGMPWLTRHLPEDGRKFAAAAVRSPREALLLSNRQWSQPVEAWPHFGFRPALAHTQETLPDGILPLEEGVRVNSLGMHLIPSGDPAAPDAFISRWETRVRDYQEFATATGRPWSKPSFPQGQDDPAVMLSAADCDAFCKWLTAREQEAGTLPPGLVYRLPETFEWLRWQIDGPADTNARIDQFRDWIGTSGLNENVFDLSRSAALSAEGSPVSTLNDGHPWTSPVGSYSPLMRGDYHFYDVGGNVAERQLHPRLFPGAVPDRTPAWGENFDRPLIFDWCQPRRLMNLLDPVPSPLVGFRVVLAKPARDTVLTRERVLDDSVVFEGHTYAWVSASCTWYQADTFARDMGGHLATITTSGEHEWLLNHVGISFIDGRRPAVVDNPRDKSNYAWTTGEPVTYDGWAPDHPNDWPDAVFIVLCRWGGNGWHNYTQKHDRITGFVIEWDSLLPPSPPSADK